MLEEQRIVESIRSALLTGIRGRTAELEDLARAYEGACREVNDRLLRCADYLRRGLRGEAIELAETPPKALELFAVLDMREAEEWGAACAKLNLPRAPRLLVSAGKELSEAYAQQAPLEGLLTRHRTLALLRAPVKERLEVLRELAKADPASPCWDEEVRTFEQQRLREMKAQAIAAVRKRDLETVEKLRKELEQPWRTLPDEDLTVNLERAGSAFTKEAAVRELRELAPRLSAAYSAMAHPEARQLVARWREIVRTSEVEVPDDLIAEVRPVNRWLEEQSAREERGRRFREQCVRLGALIDAGRPAEDLAREHAVLSGMRDEIPDELERRYRKRIEDENARQREEKRHQRVFLLMVLAAGLVTIAAMVVAAIKLSGR